MPQPATPRKVNGGATDESPLIHIANRLRSQRSDWLALGLITLTVIIFFSPVLLGGYWLPNSGGDLVSFLWPTYSFASRMLHSSQLPLWNPRLYSGAPLWADNQSSILYPPNLLVMLLTNVPYQALEGLVIFHIWLAGVGMYTCLRWVASPADRDERSSIGPAPAAVGAILFMLSDLFVTHIGNLNLIAVAAWLPLVFVGTWRALSNLSWRWAIFGGVVFGLGTLAGHAQMSLFTVMLIGGVGVYRVIADSAAEKRISMRRVAICIALVALIAIVGLALSAGGWLPAVEMTQATARLELAYDAASKFSLPPKALIGLVAPWVYGRGPANFTGKWDRVEVGYIGIIGLALSIAGAILSIRGKATRTAGIFLTLMAALAFLMALGRFFPLHQLAWEVIPGFRSVRAPARFVLLMNFAEAILAAFAVQRFDALVRGAKAWRGIPISNLIWLALVLVAAELIAFGAGTEIDARDPRAGYQHPEITAWLASQPDQPFRIDAAPASSWQPDNAASVGAPLYDIYGIANPLTIATYNTYYWAVTNRGSPTYNALGVRFVLSDSGPPGDASFVPVKEFPDGITAYLNQNALPMALLVYRAVPVDTQPAAFARVHRPSWDARRMVVVEGGPAIDEYAPPDAFIAYQRYDANTIDLQVNTSRPAYLVLSEVYYPGWIATIDGQPAPIYRANSTFRAIFIDIPGSHQVEMVFRPALVYAGLAVSLLTTGGLIGLLVWSMTRGPRRSPRELKLSNGTRSA